LNKKKINGTDYVIESMEGEKRKSEMKVRGAGK
jgi:hypothetical protein